MMQATQTQATDKLTAAAKASAFANGRLSIVVVGGGSAGWLTAALLAADHQADPRVSVTLIESASVPTIGVGEGTWPSMRATLA